MAGVRNQAVPAMFALLHTKRARAASFGIRSHAFDEVVIANHQAAMRLLRSERARSYFLNKKDVFGLDLLYERPESLDFWDVGDDLLSACCADATE